MCVLFIFLINKIHHNVYKGIYEMKIEGMGAWGGGEGIYEMKMDRMAWMAEKENIREEKEK